MANAAIKPLPHRNVFLQHVARGMLAGSVLIIASLAAGMAGYHWFEHMPWIDAFLNAAMILSGMGPVAELTTTGGKMFAGIYAIYSGIALISVAGLMLAPLLHRFLHRFHLEIR